MVHKAEMKEACFIFLALLGCVNSIPSPTNLLLVYADNWIGDDDFNGVQDSLQIAQHYASKYSVPASNMLALTITNFAEFDSYTQFYDTFASPLNTKLAALGTQNVEAIALVYGIPFRISGYSIVMDSMIWFPAIYTSTQC